MGAEIILPRMSDSMREGSVLRWLKDVGDAIATGEPLVEVETDKVTIVLDAPATGYLGGIFVAEGGMAEVGSPIGLVVDDPLETVPAPPSSNREAASSGASTTSAQPRTRTAPTPGLGASKVRASPLARKRARQAGLDLSLLTGSGPDGRVLRHDVEDALSSLDSSTRHARGSAKTLQPSRAHTLMARRMTESKQHVPHYYVTTEVDVYDALRVVDQARSLERPMALSLTHLFVYSCALALAELPDVNSSWVDGTLVRHEHVNVGIAVARDDGTLVVPVLEAVEALSLQELVTYATSLVERARNGSLTPADVAGGTFTVSNLGMFDVDEFHAIINPPESGILAIGAATERAVVSDGQIVARPAVRLSLSADHRVYAGVAAATFLQRVKRRIEQPLELWLRGSAAS